MGPGFISPEGAVDGNGVISGSEASMGPGFISPEGIMSRHGPACRQRASMGPGFISPEGGDCTLNIGKNITGFNGTGLHQPGRHLLARLNDYRYWLQWDRASSARKAC